AALIERCGKLILKLAAVTFNVSDCRLSGRFENVRDLIGCHTTLQPRPLEGDHSCVKKPHLSFVLDHLPTLASPPPRRRRRCSCAGGLRTGGPPPRGCRRARP